MRWLMKHRASEIEKPGKDDQTTLMHAIKWGRARGLRLGRLQNNFAVAFVEAKEGTDKARRASQLLGPYPCMLLHLTLPKLREQEKVCRLCDRDKDRPRVMVQMNKRAYVMAFDQAKLDKYSGYRAPPMDWSERHVNISYDWFEEVRVKKEQEARKIMGPPKTPLSSSSSSSLSSSPWMMVVPLVLLLCKVLFVVYFPAQVRSLWNWLRDLWSKGLC